MRKLIVAGAALVLGATASAAPPKLIILISVDQLSADLFDQYRQHFTGGLARVAGGTVYRNGYQGHASTETCPGHAALITGTHPARNGIIANSWVDAAAPRADKSVYCVEDESAPGSDSLHYVRSVKHLRVPSFGDLLKQRFPQARVVAVAGKDRSAILFGGHSPDADYYLDGPAFIGAGGAVDQTALKAVNGAIAAQIAAAEPAMVPPPLCAAKARPVAIPEHAPVGDGTFARTAGDVAAWRTSPASDAASLTLGAVLVNRMGLGKGPQTDFLGLGLSATDYVGHAYGSQGQEMCLQLLALDRDLGDFFARLDGWGVDYAVALSADHGSVDIPERARGQGSPEAARIDLDLTPKSVSAAVRAATGLKGPILADIGVAGDLYFDPALPDADRARALAAVLAEYRRHPQVMAAFAKAEIAAVPMPSGNPVKWSLIERVRASFDPARSGDLYVVLKPAITPIGRATGIVATHGSPWDYDRRVPVLFWRKGEAPRSDDAPVETVDVVPSLAALAEIPLAPGSVDGKCLPAFANVRCPTK